MSTKKIYKYPIPLVDQFTLQLPYKAQILCVQTQQETPCIWALVDPKAVLETISFVVKGTGHPFDYSEDYKYIGTFQLHDGSLVFHLFEYKGRDYNS